MPENRRNREESESLKQLRTRLESESNDGLQLLKDLADNPVCSVTFDENIPCIVVAWKQYATSTQLRYVHESLINLLEQHRVSKILGDDTALATIHNDDQSWIVGNWMPRAMASGLRAAASKSPSSYFGKVSVESVQSIAPPGVVLRSFADMAEARQWLKNHSA